MQKKLPSRKLIRLKEYDYSQAGYYFITICVKDGRKLLGNIDITPTPNSVDTVGAPIGHPVELSQIGLKVESAILQISKKYKDVSLDKYIVMPNHIHMILILQQADKSSGRPMGAPTISTVINQFKGYITKQIGFSIWQKSFHDHIIRNKKEYLHIWRYIDENPAYWSKDKYYSD